MDITIPEAILLLGLDDESGKPVVSDSTVGMAFAAGAAAQLVLQGRIRIAGDDEGDATPGTFMRAGGQADERLEPLVEHLVGRKPKDALGKLVGLGGAGAPAAKVRAQSLDDFAEAGLLARRDQRFLGLTWGQRWERGERTEVEDALQARAREILQGAGDDRDSPVDAGRDEVLAAALAILHTVEALPKVFPELPKEQLAAAGAALAADDWASESVRESVKALEGAMVAIMLTTVILPAATGSH